jgi:hypothetical protein
MPASIGKAFRSDRLWSAGMCLLFLSMLVHPRAFASTVVALSLLGFVVVLVTGRAVRPATATLAALALVLGAALNTVVTRGWSFDAIDHPLLMIAFLLAGFEALRRTERVLAGFVPAFALLAGSAALLVYAALSWGLPAFRVGVDLADATLIGEAFAKHLMLLVCAGWLLIGIGAAKGVAPGWAALCLPIAAAVVSPSQSLSLGLLLGTLAAVLASSRLLIAAAAAATFLIAPIAALALPADVAETLPGTWAWRVDLWSEGLRLAAERPLTGWGFQSFGAFKETLMDLPRVNHAHSAAIELALDFGVWAFLPIGAAAWAVAHAAGGSGRALDAIPLGRRVAVVPPLVCWLVIANVSFELWNDFVLAGLLFLLALAVSDIRGDRASERAG